MGGGDGADVDEGGGGGVESPRGEAEMEERDAHCCGGGGEEWKGEGRKGEVQRWWWGGWAEGKRRHRVEIRTTFIHHEYLQWLFPDLPVVSIDWLWLRAHLVDHLSEVNPLDGVQNHGASLVHKPQGESIDRQVNDNASDTFLGTWIQSTDRHDNYSNIPTVIGPRLYLNLKQLKLYLPTESPKTGGQTKSPK